MQNKYSRPLAIVVLVLIVVYGILKNWVLSLYANLLDWSANIVGLGQNPIFELVKDQALKEERREKTLGWIIYYPTYFLLHIAFIYLLFYQNKKARNYLMIGLTGVITLIIICWVGFKALGMPGLALFFREQFRNLFGLPFILLAIEGGRILYRDMMQLIRNDAD